LLPGIKGLRALEAKMLGEKRLLSGDVEAIQSDVIDDKSSKAWRGHRHQREAGA
jgi:hypothetical protein